jgi:hypothetical protein
MLGGRNVGGQACKGHEASIKLHERGACHASMRTSEDQLPCSTDAVNEHGRVGWSSPAPPAVQMLVTWRRATVNGPRLAKAASAVRAGAQWRLFAVI